MSPISWGLHCNWRLTVITSHNGLLGSLWWCKWEFSRRLICWKSWCPVGLTVWRVLRGTSLLKDVCYCGWALRFQKTLAIPSVPFFNPKQVRIRLLPNSKQAWFILLGCTQQLASNCLLSQVKESSPKSISWASFKECNHEWLQSRFTKERQWINKKVYKKSQKTTMWLERLIREV